MRYATRRPAAVMAGTSQKVRLAGALVTALMALGVTSCQGRDQSSSTGTKVGAKQAFDYYGISMPASMRNLYYRADPTDDTYPLAAVFDIGCQDVQEFVSRSRLQRSSEADMPNAGLETFASERGWVAQAKADSWYQRYFDKYQTIAVLVHQVSGNCRVFIDV